MENNRKISNETKVSLLLGGTFAIALLFAWLLGANNPFKKTITLFITYNFAGGIEVGSPIRVGGIKVGKVEKIKFYKPDDGSFKSDDARQGEVLTPIKIEISVDRDAAESIRKDSKFYINLAGVIGERYIEITPGTYSAVKIENKEIVRGIDPPRIDQLISQSFDLMGKIKQVIVDNEGDITKSIKLLYDLSSNINKTVANIDKSKLFQTNLSELITNLIEISRDVKTMTAKTQSEEGKKTLELLHKLLWRLEPFDREAISKFLQKEGIKAKLF